MPLPQSVLPPILKLEGGEWRDGYLLRTTCVDRPENLEFSAE